MAEAIVPNSALEQLRKNQKRNYAQGGPIGEKIATMPGGMGLGACPIPLDISCCCYKPNMYYSCSNQRFGLCNTGARNGAFVPLPIAYREAYEECRWIRSQIAQGKATPFQGKQFSNAFR